ncbi:hypothetical protein DMH04_32030 [Kibdelosporangium aridum]|uniref:Uncharacterized protein n=2 Tax=Kibdelosporangium aridum TaxID=2030 RepID=A0A428Z274_KIBAR|nr:hypothetical protein DMH04_32030 [Kibdelosporangium aridum]
MALADVQVLDSPYPAAEALRQLCNRDDLRSLTLVPAEQYESVANLLPTGQRLATRAAPAVRHKIDVSATELVQRVTVLRRHHLDGKPSRHQPLTLLWAIGQLAVDAPRLHPWHVFKPQVGELLAEFGGEGSSATPEFPFWHLRRTGVWEVDGLEPGTISKPRAGLFDSADPRAGFTEEAYRRLRDVTVRTRVINALRVRHLADIENNHLLLERVGLTDYAKASGAGKFRAESAGQLPARQQTTRQEVDRCATLAKQVKALHDNTCQLCGKQLMLADGFHSEAAHIRGLGQPHCGPDVLSNLLCLCPNCHAQFDNFAVYVDEDDVVRHVLGRKYLAEFRRHPEHEIDDDHLRRHREMCETTEAVPDSDR